MTYPAPDANNPAAEPWVKPTVNACPCLHHSHRTSRGFKGWTFGLPPQIRMAGPSPHIWEKPHNESQRQKHPPNKKNHLIIKMIGGNRDYAKNLNKNNNPVTGTTNPEMQFGDIQRTQSWTNCDPAMPLVGIYLRETLAHVMRRDAQIIHSSIVY